MERTVHPRPPRLAGLEEAPKPTLADESSSDEPDRPIMSFPDFIKSTAPVDKPFSFKHQKQPRRSSSVYSRNTKSIFHGTTDEDIPRLGSSSYFMATYNDRMASFSAQRLATPPLTQLKEFTMPGSPESTGEHQLDDESTGSSIHLIPNRARRYPHGLTSPDISPMMMPVSSDGEVDFPPPQAYLDSDFTPPPEAFYPGDMIAEALDDPLFSDNEVVSSPESMSEHDLPVHSRDPARNKAHEALGIDASPQRKSDIHRSGNKHNHTQSYSKFRAALRSGSRDDVKSMKSVSSAGAPSYHSSRSVSSKLSLANTTHTTSTKASIQSVQQLLVEDHHQSIRELARSEREGSISSATARKEMRMIPTPLFFQDNRRRSTKQGPGPPVYPKESASFTKPPDTAPDGPASPTSPISKFRDVLPTRMFSTRGRRTAGTSTGTNTDTASQSPETTRRRMPRTPPAPKSNTESLTSDTTSPRTPTVSRPSTSRSASNSFRASKSTSTSASPTTPTPTLTRKTTSDSHKGSIRSLTSPRRLFVHATPSLFKTTSTKLRKSPKQGDGQRDIDADDAWRAQVKASIKVVGEKDPNEVGVGAEPLSNRKEPTGKQYAEESKGNEKARSKESERSVAVRDHIGWDRAKATLRGR